MAKNTTLGAEALLRVIQIKRAEVVALLLKYGQVVTPTTPDVEIALMVTKYAKKSESFYNAFMKLIADKNVLSSLYSSMDGYSNAGGVFYEPMKFDIGTPSSSSTSFCDKPENKSLGLCSGGSTTSDTKPTKTKGSGEWLTTILNLAQTGFNGYMQLDDNKTKRALAEASVKVTEAGGSMGGGMGGNTNLTPAKSNTALYVILGVVGVSVIGLVVYLATKKKA